MALGKASLMSVSKKYNIFSFHLMSYWANYSALFRINKISVHFFVKECYGSICT